ncbi:RHS repeat protein [Thermomonas sp. S9]|uniref:RHS repeat domain-containing protein n=1 Tax=Thermomonas sp. S9 TaxID=2885203 RepID=UPI00216ABEF7|nr:RHS repeat domain-containing protein [Thermomonas sp. S9]MCR6497151.1 RHS repeat protein [Thermomonas sp. S9]
MKKTGIAFSACLLVTGGLCSGTAAAQTYRRTELISYHDNTSKWVLGQTASVTCIASVPASASCDGDDVMSQTAYDPATALPVATYAFGKLQSAMTYNADGTLATWRDGRGNVTTFGGWKRGIPQSIQYADGTSQSAVVDDNGWIVSVTNEAGSKTCYGYDPMGRVSSITYPSEAVAGGLRYDGVGADQPQLRAGECRRIRDCGRSLAPDRGHGQCGQGDVLRCAVAAATGA